ncbi:hypothetical protein AVEN_267270-1 [Araneus ventricosus]|uniref:Uncharacterized protein n=1 Tax=Araneus ventricosus TaxID=182803 RepID=A0A4Y2MB81_ARAVE|nr:hypothetical protein AVEN_267270-1 [Araneus ventricosus]
MQFRNGLVVRSRPWGHTVPGSKADSTEDPSCMRSCCTLNHTKLAKRPPAGVVWKFGQGVPAQVSSSSFDLYSKLRDLSRSRTRVVS